MYIYSIYICIYTTNIYMHAWLWHFDAVGLKRFQHNYDIRIVSNAALALLTLGLYN